MTELLPQTCRSQHQCWTATLVESEQEVDQLLHLFNDLPDGSYRSLTYQTTNYVQALNSLKDRIRRVRVNVLCSGAGCAVSPPSAPCGNVRYTDAITVNMNTILIGVLSTDYSRLRERCHTFLSELMRLNLI